MKRWRSLKMNGIISPMEFCIKEQRSNKFCQSCFVPVFVLTKYSQLQGFNMSAHFFLSSSVKVPTLFELTSGRLNVLKTSRLDHVPAAAWPTLDWASGARWPHVWPRNLLSFRGADGWRVGTRVLWLQNQPRLPPHHHRVSLVLTCCCSPAAAHSRLRFSAVGGQIQSAFYHDTWLATVPRWRSRRQHRIGWIEAQQGCMR